MRFAISHIILAVQFQQIINSFPIVLRYGKLFLVFPMKLELLIQKQVNIFSLINNALLI